MACNMRCGICEDEYDNNEKKPMVLPCGHSFCQACLQQVATSTDQNCSTCRSEWKGDTENLPICFQLLPKTDSSFSTASGRKLYTAGLCQTHTYVFQFWCTNCEVAACKMCSILSHTSCKLILLEDTDSRMTKFTAAYKQIRSRVQKIQNNRQDTKNTIIENMTILQKFNKVVKEVEIELDDEVKKISALEVKLSTDLKSVDSRLNGLKCESDGYDLEGAESDRLLMYQLEEHLHEVAGPKDLALCVVAKTFMETKDLQAYITELRQPKEKFGHKKEWHIRNDDEAIEAFQTMSQFDKRPDIVTVNSTEKEPLKIGLGFLPSLAKEATELRLQLFDSFWLSNEVTFDTERVSYILDHKDVLKIGVFFGRLDQPSIQKLTLLRILGQKLQDPIDLTAVSVRFAALTEFHFSVLQTFDPTHGQLHAHLLDKLICAHFPALPDDKLTWMQQTINKLVPSSTNKERIKALYLPHCRLSMDGMEVLLGLVHGGFITSVVWVGQHTLSYLQVQKLIQMYNSYGITLHTDGKFTL